MSISKFKLWLKCTWSWKKKWHVNRKVNWTELMKRALRIKESRWSYFSKWCLALLLKMPEKYGLMGSFFSNIESCRYATLLKINSFTSVFHRSWEQVQNNHLGYLLSTYFCRKTVGDLLVTKNHISCCSQLFQRWIVRITEYVIYSFYV